MTCARSVLSIALVAALAAPAAAESTAVPTTPEASAIAIMRDSGQALLWDASRGEYLLVKAGDHFRDFFVVTISDDAVVVAAANDPKVRHMLRLAPAPTSRTGKARVARPTVITLAPSDAGGAALDVIDPYPTDGLDVVDPYGAPPGKTVTTVAPTVVRGERQQAANAAPEVREIRAPARSAVDEPAVASGAAPAVASPAEAAPAVAAPPKQPASRKRIERRVVVKRADLDAVLADFDTLAREIQVERADGGGVRVVGLSRGSFFDRTGVRAEDVVRSVAGVRLTTVESAAMVYARVMSSDEFEVEIDRGDRRVILTYAVE